jgi:hypothetical protein
MAGASCGPSGAAPYSTVQSRMMPSSLSVTWAHLKRGYGWDRTRLDGRHGASIWCGHRVFARNLIKIGALAS